MLDRVRPDGVVALAMGTVVATNNALVRSAATEVANPWPLDGCAWNDRVEAGVPTMRAEWDAFVGAGGRLPRIEQVLGEDQGNDGHWRAGLLIHGGRPVAPLADRFPATLAVLAAVPGLRSALWSVLEPGAALPDHHGPNAGILRYHVGVVAQGDTALRVGTTVVPYREGSGILFDDTAEHAAWNRGSAPRVTIMGELLRPVAGAPAWANRAVQGLRSRDRRFRLAPVRAAEWDHALNPALAGRALR